MTRARSGIVLSLLGGVLAASGCTVPSTPVLDAGEAPEGIYRGFQLYFVNNRGQVQAVDRPTAPPLKSMDEAVARLLQGPTMDEFNQGLSTRLDVDQIRVIDHPTGATVYSSDTWLPSNRLAFGQLVCTLARAASELSPTTATSEFSVVAEGPKGRSAPTRCADFPHP